MFHPDTTQRWAFWNGAISPDECKQIIAYGNTHELDQGETVGNLYASDLRKAELTWLSPHGELEWLARRLTDVIQEVNRQYFGFDLYGMVEGFQFTKYEAPSGNHSLHMDSSPGITVRKLSLSLQLSAPSDYEGGELEVVTGKTPEVASKEQGSITIFPSYVLHEVKPVTSGTRYSLVAWVTGPAFK
jgi:PKHD-type hydroxylase